MESTRAVYFEIDHLQKVVVFGTYALMMYYAKQINPTKAKKLFDATLSEWKYRVENALPEDGLDGLDDLEAHFVPSDVQEAITFIDDELIPALSNELYDLFVKYGGRDNFYKLYYTNPSFLVALGLNTNEFYFAPPSSVAAFLLRLKEVFIYALSVNKPFIVFIN